MPGFTTRPEIRGTFGVVATTHWLASAIGMSVLWCPSDGRVSSQKYSGNPGDGWDDSPITAPRLMHEVKQSLPENALVFAEGITNSRHIEMALAPDEPATRRRSSPCWRC